MESVVDSRSRSLGSRPGCGYSSVILLTYYPSCLCGTQGSNKILTTLSIFSQFFNGAPAVIEPPQSLLYCPAPSCFRAPSASFAFRCPVHCNSGYVVTGLPHHMTPQHCNSGIIFRGNPTMDRYLAQEKKESFCCSTLQKLGYALKTNYH